ncbi:hypothetical protein ACJRO7_021491 [Eucalyptus globulus]|uniref:Uncharacterized protein n=1 Tax=Eucalyptus globulus TaxID=34317 RepID=A0ABD3KWQ2_EUCGL
MDNNRGGPQATAEEHEIELMKQQLVPSMSEDIEKALRRFNVSAGGEACTIFRVPEAIGGGIAKACRPRIVSIGPYHHGESQLEMLQGHKWRYLHNMLGRTQQHGIRLENLIHVVAPKEKMIRQCYSESTDNFSGPDLVRMMVLDGCFIIEFLRQLGGVVPTLNGPLLYNISVKTCVMQDLLRLENQVPYFVLEDLFEATNVLGGTLSLADLIFKFFSCNLKGPDNVKERRMKRKGEHLLDEFRLSLIPWDKQDNQVDNNSSFAVIRSASELRQVGIGFKQREASTFLDIKFGRTRRKIGIPKITVDDNNFNWILPNMVAFEQCHGRENDYHVTAYAMFMGCLIRTINDVQLLRDCKVISNHGMSNEEFARLFDDIRKAAPFELVKESYLASQFAMINKFLRYEQAYRFWGKYLKVFCGNLLTLASMIQTVYALLQYYHSK